MNFFYVGILTYLKRLSIGIEVKFSMTRNSTPAKKSILFRMSIAFSSTD